LEPRKSHIRHLAKTITWRIVGTIDTILIGWLVSGDVRVGATIGGFEVISKLLLYYLHERAWFKWGSLGRVESTHSDPPKPSAP